jgi:hypothetical protein
LSIPYKGSRLPVIRKWVKIAIPALAHRLQKPVPALKILIFAL